MSVSNGLCPRVVSTLQHVNENFEGDVVVHARKETKKPPSREFGKSDKPGKSPALRISEFKNLKNSTIT